MNNGEDVRMVMIISVSNPCSENEEQGDRFARMVNMDDDDDG